MCRLAPSLAHVATELMAFMATVGSGFSLNFRVFKLMFDICIVDRNVTVGVLLEMLKCATTEASVSRNNRFSSLTSRLFELSNGFLAIYFFNFKLLVLFVSGFNVKSTNGIGLYKTPWDSYKYQCRKFMENVSQTTGQATFQSRLPCSLADIFQEFPTLLYTHHVFQFYKYEGGGM